MSATDHLAASELVTWRTLIGAARAAVDRPSHQSFRVFEVAAKKANKVPFPAPGDKDAMYRFWNLVKAGQAWGAISAAEQLQREPDLRTAIDACAEILGPEPLPAPAAPEPRKPYYLEDDG